MSAILPFSIALAMIGWELGDKRHQGDVCVLGSRARRPHYGQWDGLVEPTGATKTPRSTLAAVLWESAAQIAKRTMDNGEVTVPQDTV